MPRSSRKKRSKLGLPVYLGTPYYFLKLTDFMPPRTVPGGGARVYHGCA